MVLLPTRKGISLLSSLSFPVVDAESPKVSKSALICWESRSNSDGISIGGRKFHIGGSEMESMGKQVAEVRQRTI